MTLSIVPTRIGPDDIGAKRTALEMAPDDDEMAEIVVETSELVDTAFEEL